MSMSSPMIRSAPRLFLRSSKPLIRPLRPQRQFSLAPPSQRSRSWRNVTIRWGLAICGIYYYNTSNVFAEEPIPAPSILSSTTDDISTETLESIAAARHPPKDTPSKPSIHSNPPDSLSDLSSEETGTSLFDLSSEETATSLDETAEEASQEGAFNEETGEINWDCPCLGGMAHGPCGEAFRASFSCFVFSKEEPKGMDCIDHFKNMQDCFRQHPDIYGSELDGDDGDDGDAEPPSSAIADDPSASSPPSASNKSSPPNDQADQQAETIPPSPKSNSSSPQVDEPSQQQSQPPSDAPQPPSGELQTKPPHEPNREDESTAPGRKNIDEKSTLSAPLSS